MQVAKFKVGDEVIVVHYGEPVQTSAVVSVSESLPVEIRIDGWANIFDGDGVIIGKKSGYGKAYKGDVRIRFGTKQEIDRIKAHHARNALKDLDWENVPDAEVLKVLTLVEEVE